MAVYNCYLTKAVTDNYGSTILLRDKDSESLIIPVYADWDQQKEVETLLLNAYEHIPEAHRQDGKAYISVSGDVLQYVNGWISIDGHRMLVTLHE